MKKIFLFILIFICLKGFSQYPNKQTLGSPTSRLEVIGAVQAVKGLINGRYADTTAANLGYIDFYNGSQIFTTTDKILWLRDSVLNKWVNLSAGGSATDTSNKWVNNITKNAGGDSIIYYINTTRYAVSDPGSIYTASQGLTLTGSNFTLGGTVSSNRVLTVGSNWITLDGTTRSLILNADGWATSNPAGGGGSMYIQPGAGSAFPGITYLKGAVGSGTTLVATGVHWVGTAGGNKHHFISDMRDSIQYVAIESAGTHMAAFGTLWNGHHTDLGAKGKISIASTGFLDHAGNKGYLDNYKSTYLRDSLMYQFRSVVTDSTGGDLLWRSRTAPYEVKQISIPALAALIGGGGGSSLFPVTGTGTATGNVIGDLGTNQTLLVSGNIATEMMTVSNSGAGAALYSASGGPAYFGYSLPGSTNTVVPVMQLQRGSSGTPANGIGGSIDFYLQPATGFAQLSNQLISKWTNATAATRTSQFDLTGVNSAATEVFANFQTSGIVRVNNLADTLATRAYARSVGGSGGETNTASNLGGGLANYSTKVGVDLQFNSFFATDFDLASNQIFIDYVNGQKASNTVSGFVSATTQTFSAGKTFNAPLNVKDAGGAYLQGFQIINSASVAQTSILHEGGSFFIGLATAASGADASGDFIQRFRAYEETATGTNPIIELGDNDLRINHDGTANYAGNFGIATAVPTEKLHVTGNIKATGTGAFGGDVTVPDEVYGSGWNGSLEVPTKNALWDKIETIAGSVGGVLYRTAPLYNVNDSTLGVDSTLMKIWPGSIIAGATMSLGSDADNDMYFRNGTVLARLAYGTTGQYLKATTGSDPSWGGVALNHLIAATATNSINNADFAQTWQWNSLTADGALNLTSSSTAATGNNNTVLYVGTTGTNANASQSTFAAQFTNNKNGGAGGTSIGMVALANTSSGINIGGQFAAISGTNNYAIIVPAASGRVGFGTSAPVASALLEMSSTTQGFLPPRMTTTQRDAVSSPATGLSLYNTTTNTPNYYNGTAWTAPGGAGTAGQWIVACSDETTAITTGTAKVTFRVPFGVTVTGVRASVNTVSSSGIPTIDINEAGTTILSTKLTIDASEFTSVTAAAAAVISDTALADDAEITIDFDVAGTGAKGVKIIIYYTRN